MRSLRATLAAALLAATAAILPAAVPAAASSHACPASLRWRGDRVCIQASNPHGGLSVELHIQRRSGHDHARALAMLPEGGSIWLQVRHGGHTSFAGVREVKPGSTDNHYASSSQQTRGWQYDGPGYKVRGCAGAPHFKTVCTSWH